VERRRKGIPFVRIWRVSFGAIISGVREDPNFRGLAVAVGGLLGSGTIAYMLLEDWSFVDALYFATIILTTIGLGDGSPESDAAKLFTVAYSLIGIGVLVAFGTAFAGRLVAQAEADRRR
jgi:hypothetical protein